MLKRPTFEERAVLDGTVKWAIHHAINQGKRIFGNLPKKKEKEGWNHEELKIAQELAIKAILERNPSVPTYLQIVQDIIRIGAAVLDEEKEPELGGLTKWAVGFGLDYFHRSAKHLIWKNADRGTWNRPLCELLWEVAHEALRESGIAEKDPQLAAIAKQGIDSASLIADADDPYYMVFKWGLCNVRDELGFDKLIALREQTENKYLLLLCNSLEKMVKDGRIMKLQKDWGSDVCAEAARHIDKVHVEVGGIKDQKKATARKNSPL